MPPNYLHTLLYNWNLGANLCGKHLWKKPGRLNKNYIFCKNAKMQKFNFFSTDTNQNVHRFLNPDELTAHFKMYFEKERFNPLLGENLLKE